MGAPPLLLVKGHVNIRLRSLSVRLSVKGSVSNNVGRRLKLTVRCFYFFGQLYSVHITPTVSVVFYSS